MGSSVTRSLIDRMSASDLESKLHLPEEHTYLMTEYDEIF